VHVAWLLWCRGALKLGMALTSAAGSMAAAVLPVLLFLRVTHRVTMSYFVVFGVLWIAILGAAALGFQSSRRFKPRREVRRLVLYRTCLLRARPRDFYVRHVNW
jgi:hypothetical protein